jgi:sigma54-dependent transcription regulator
MKKPSEPQTTILDWYVSGEKGISSETMAATALGKKHGLGYAPSDPADLNRCIKLVDTAPEVKDAFPKIAALSEQWKAVIDNWDKLREMFIAEVGYDWSKKQSAPKTYKEMKGIGL